MNIIIFLSVFISLSLSSYSSAALLFPLKNLFKYNNELNNISSYSQQHQPQQIRTGAFTVNVDHFRPQDTRKVQFYYKLNLEYYHVGGPLLFFIDDTTNGDTFIESGLMVDIARDIGGALITYDRRYFGLNIPTETSSFEDLQYNTVEQHLADIATLIVTVKRHLGTSNPKVGLWGVSHGGALAIWAKRKYPHLIDAAWSSSGKLLPFTTGPDYLLQFASNLFYHGDENCFNTFEEIWNIFDDLLENNESEILQEAFNLCEPLNTESENDIALFFLTIIQYLSGFVNQYTVRGIQQMCNALQVIPNNPFDSFVRWYRFNFDAYGCMDNNFNDFIETNLNTNWNVPDGGDARQFFYFTCSQFGYFITTVPNFMFPNIIPEQFYINLCENLYGNDYNYSALQNANNNLRIMYGDYVVPTNEYLFTNGNLDGWITRGVTNIYHPHQELAYIINIEYAYLGSDLTSIIEWEAATIIEAKLRIIDLITDWVSDDDAN